MQWTWKSAALTAIAAFTANNAMAAEAAKAVSVPQLESSRLERSLEKHSLDQRYTLDVRLTPLPQEQRSNRFSLRTELAPKALTAVCTSGNNLFANGFETL